MNQNKISVKCKVCDNNFDLDTTGLNVGDIIECPVCGATLEIISLDPFMVDPVVKGK